MQIPNELRIIMEEEISIMKSRFASPLRSEQGLKATTIEEVLALPDEEIDIATAILLLSKEWDKIVDVEKYRKRIDGMAMSLEPIVAKVQTPDAIVKAINDYLFEELKYGVPEAARLPSTITSQNTAGNLDEKLILLHSVLDAKRGNCIGLSMLYLSLTERLNLPIYGVVVPYHFFVRYDDNRTKINIETTSKGESVSGDDYTTHFQIPTGTLYLVNLNKKQTVGCFLSTLGGVYSQQGKLDEAIAKYKTAISINPNYPDAHYNLGNACKEQGKLDEAVVEYKIALIINPNCAKAYGNLGLAYQEQGKLDEAIAEYKTVIGINPKEAKAHYNLGLVYQKQGKLNEAIAAYKTAIKIDPNQSKAYVNLGLVYQKQGKLNEAIAKYKAAISITPDDEIAHYNLGNAYREQDKFDKAIDEYKTAININPNYAKAHSRLGFVYVNQWEFKEAIVEYKTAININPDCAEAHLGLGNVYRMQDKLDEAIAEYKTAIRIEPNLAQARHGLGLAYLLQGKVDET